MKQVGPPLMTVCITAAHRNDQLIFQVWRSESNVLKHEYKPTMGIASRQIFGTVSLDRHSRNQVVSTKREVKAMSIVRDCGCEGS